MGSQILGFFGKAGIQNRLVKEIRKLLFIKFKNKLALTALRVRALKHPLFKDCFVSCGFLVHCYQTSLLTTLLPDNTRTAFESQ